jgi:hypothetical protein
VSHDYFREAEIGGVFPFHPSWEGEGVRDLFTLKSYIEYSQVKVGLLDPYSDQYPLPELRELQPPFDSSLTEYKELPGFSTLAMDKMLVYQKEPFQFDLFHAPTAHASPEAVMHRNIDMFLARLPRADREAMVSEMGSADITQLKHYPRVLSFVCRMDRGHVIARESDGAYRLMGIYASFPSDLDWVLKRFGLKIGKFRTGDDKLYERNRLFVYRYLMELYGFPIASERRTSAAMFTSRLIGRNENFFISVLGNSDRVVTFLSSRGKGRWPVVEKFSLVSVDSDSKAMTQALEDGGFFLDPKRKVIVFKVTYTQHEYNPDNIIEDRALSVVEQEAIHPVTGERFTNLDLLKTTRRYVVRLNDIVRGEHQGQILYKGQDVVYGTEDHSSRLKFLHAWLSKHRRAFLGYSPKTFRKITHTLSTYLENPDTAPELAKYPKVLSAVKRQVEVLKQEYEVVNLRNSLEGKDGAGRPPSYRERLALLVDFLSRERELVRFDEEVFEKVMFLCDRVLDNTYFNKRYRRGKKRTFSRYENEVMELYDEVMKKRSKLEWKYFRSSHASSAV